jgi:hypothetical protein
MKLLLWIVLILSGGTLLYLGYIFLAGWSAVRSAPRADMFICPKGHGPLPESALIDFMGEKHCSICFHNRLKDAEKGRI